MIQILFSLRFQAQLRRTRPVLFKSIENSIVEAINASGGIPGFERRYITASFDEKTIGFWLNILTVVETISKTMENAASELYGYTTVLGRDPEDEVMQYFRLLSSGEGSIWCDLRVQKALSDYGTFENLQPGEKINAAIAGYARLKNIHIFSGGGEGGETRLEKFFPYRGRIHRTLKQGGNRNALLFGPRFIGKREGIYRYCLSLMGETPPLVVTFGAGGCGVSCFADALTQSVRAFLSPSAGAEVMEELESLGVLISRDRFRNEYSDYLFFNANRFFHLLCETYGAAMGRTGSAPVIILENIHEAEAGAVQLFTGWYRSAAGKSNFLVYGTCSGEFRSMGTHLVPKPWTRIFPRILQFPVGGAADLPAPKLSVDLWEIAYAFTLFRRYFPSSRFSVLFKEAGINPRMVLRIMDFFSRQGIIDFQRDPLPRIADFILRAEEILGGRKDYIRCVVRDRILAWVNEGKINPCFNVLKALSDLGGRGSDALVLDSLMGDIINGTYKGIEEVVYTEEFETLIGENRASRLRYIVSTSKALLHGTEEDIRGAFLTLPPESDAFPLYKAHILIGITGYYLSIRDSSSALKSVKEAVMLSQSAPKGKGLVRAYRFFSLVNVSQQRLSDALEYFSFAIEHAEINGIQDELALTAYYAAGTHFLFGNISKAGRLALQSEAAAVASGRTEWADRARFLLGRLHFETGRYGDALDIFENLEIRSPPSSNQALTCSAWIFRAEVFLNRPAPRVPPVMNYDARLFTVEAAYLSGNYEETVNLADTLLTTLPEGNFLFIEQPDWRSGFFQCEFLVSSPRNLLTRLLYTYRALGLCRVDQFSGTAGGKAKAGTGNPAGSEAKSEAKSEAHDSLNRILREEGMPQTDPNDAFYYYAYYRVLQETGAVEVDMNTAISLAFKRLQSRASRIDDMETRRLFLSLNLWNKALGQAAKKHKLI
jgi:tetratricopeptide (TPR) repeat protein